MSNLTEEVCTSSIQILNLLRKGDARRHVGRTNMNEHSSRSHTIFCMVSRLSLAVYIYMIKGDAQFWSPSWN